MSEVMEFERKPKHFTGEDASEDASDSESESESEGENEILCFESDFRVSEHVQNGMSLIKIENSDNFCSYLLRIKIEKDA
jgi:hypothetical protein